MQSAPQPIDNFYKLTYRPDIDGLRAVAILAVVIFHAFPLKLPGGFIGVDIFFVISGYLISSIIFTRLQKGEFSFLTFYSNRVKRIFPSLLTVIASIYALSYIILLPDELRLLGKHMTSSLAFVQNFLLLKKAGYFDPAAELKPLLHIWSLSIEEQFYLIYPVVMVFAFKRRIKISTVLLSLITLSFFLNIVIVYKNPDKAFFLPVTRFWELLTGCFLALTQTAAKDAINKFAHRSTSSSTFFKLITSQKSSEYLINTVLSITGFILIFYGMFVINESSIFPGWNALIPVFGTMLIIISGHDNFINNKFLSNKVIVFIGLISYPLYLWHWPILSVARIFNGSPLNNQEKLILVLISFILSVLTYFLVEKPIRFGKNSEKKVKLLVLGSILLACVGLGTYVGDGFYFRLGKEKAKIARAISEVEFPKNLQYKIENGISYYFKSTKKSDITMYLGDSNVEQYLSRVDEITNEDDKNNNSVIFKTGGGCLPIPKVSHDKGHSHCENLTSEALNLAISNPNIKNFVIAAQWNGHLGKLFSENIGGEGQSNYKNAIENLSNYIKFLVEKDKKVFVILNIPVGYELDPKNVINRDIRAFPNVFSYEDRGIKKDFLARSFGAIQSDIKKAAVSAGATVIDPTEYLCEDFCFALDHKGSPKYKDWCHLSPSYVRLNASFIDVTLK